ncbi:hypothetical protein [Priestia endophytica]|uniref:hypothetical protein n=1 Tax=Priestia endophytica TaxID=135735 RepID=UPI0018CF75EB|nr:hypothetical protein [Priestia endophytica]
MYRQFCMEECLKAGGDYNSCYAWCNHVAMIPSPSYPYLVPTVYTAPYSPQPYYYFSDRPCPPSPYPACEYYKDEDGICILWCPE